MAEEGRSERVRRKRSPEGLDPAKERQTEDEDQASTEDEEASEESYIFKGGAGRKLVPGYGNLQLASMVTATIILLIAIYISWYGEKPDGLTNDGVIVIGLLLMAVILWVSEAVPLAVTGLLIIMLQPLLLQTASETPYEKEIFASFGNSAVFFLIGALMLAVAIEKHNAHKRLALKILKTFEGSPAKLTLGIFLLSVFMPFLMPEHGVVILLLPIAMLLIISMGLEPGRSNFAKVSLLSITYGASIGSLGTIIGGARNPLTIAYLSEHLDKEVSFLEWTYISWPIVLICAPLVWIILTRVFPLEKVEISRAKVILESEVQQLGGYSHGEIKVLFILAITVLMWVFLSTTISVAIIALIGCILLFITKTLDWRDVERRMQWGIILLYGGAITLGISLQNTGAAEWLSENIIEVAGSDPYMLVLLTIIITILLTNVMSNTAAVAALLPIGGAMFASAGMSELVASFVISLSGGLAFIFVIATPGNAIVYSSGYVSTRDFLKAGIIATVTCIGVIFLVAVTYWEMIGLGS